SETSHHTQTRHLTSHHLSSQTDRWGGRSSPGPAGRRTASSRCTRGHEIVLWNVVQGYHHNSSDEHAGSWWRANPRQIHILLRGTSLSRSIKSSVQFRPDTAHTQTRKFAKDGNR